MTDKPRIPATTTDAGIPVQSDEHSLTIGRDGPIVLNDHYLIEQMANFNRERIPERQPHAKGSGAFGHFEVTGDVTRYTKARFLQPGTNTETAMRFSTVAGERGSPDTWRDPRGFSVKFYTEDGNFDMVGNNTPIFFIRDPLKFQHFIRSQKRRADNGLRDHDMQWDFWTLSPESAHQVTYLMGDRGIPKNWREMNGYGSHTYMLVNEAGEKHWVKWHFMTDQGTESGNAHLTQDDADRMAGIDGDYHRRDLFEHIAKGEFPSWTLKFQLMPFDDAKTYRINPFDLTKVWSHADYPLIEVGKLTLTANPVDWDTQIEQLAFEPDNMVPGIGLSPDKMLLARGFSYSDAHRARLGVNYKQIPVNQARNTEVHSYSRAGQGRTVNALDPVYAPNSYGGPGAQPQVGGEATWMADGDMVRAAYTLREGDDDWSQPGALVRAVMDDEQRDRFVGNVAGHLSNGVSEPILVRAFDYWRNVDKDIGDRIETATRDLIGGTSAAPGMASAESISGYRGVPATADIARSEGQKNAVKDLREPMPAK
jgi:catalase